MSNKILAIKERVPQVTSLPDGVYMGKWGGYVITVNYNGKTYECETEEGIRGIGFSVVVTIDGGVATFREAKN
jgi:hypothetical protein